MAEGISRFAQTSETERNVKRRKLNSDITLRTNKGSAKVFKDYLNERGENEKFKEFDDVKLDEWLGHFTWIYEEPTGHIIRPIPWRVLDTA